MIQSNDQRRQKEVARYVANAASDLERTALLHWTQGLLEVRDANLTKRQKLAEVAKLTTKYKVAWPIAKIMAAKLKEIAWDNRSTKMRVGLGTAAAAFAVFGSQGAGVAALGTAIGVPLWVVFGAGATFAWVLVEELQERKPPKTSITIEDEKDEKQE